MYKLAVLGVSIMLTAGSASQAESATRSEKINIADFNLLSISPFLCYPLSTLNANARQQGEWREGVGVEPTRDVYSPILDLKA